jgi:hypothetical protein
MDKEDRLGLQDLVEMIDLKESQDKDVEIL